MKALCVTTVEKPRQDHHRGNYETSDAPRSNFALLTDLLDNYHPKSPGIATAEEVLLIKAKLYIENRDLLSLQNLRDFTVIFLCEQQKKAEDNNDRARMFELMDICSAVTCVIDQAKFNLGGAV